MFRKQFHVPILIAASLAVSVAVHAQPGNGLKIEAGGASLKASGPTAASPFILALDAGHGGRDTGSRGSGELLEKDVTLRVVKLLAERLGRRPEIKVVFTREADTEFNRFGFVTTWIDGNGQHVYFDDLTYTWKQ